MYFEKKNELKEEKIRVPARNETKNEPKRKKSRKKINTKGLRNSGGIGHPLSVLLLHSET